MKTKFKMKKSLFALTLLTNFFVFSQEKESSNTFNRWSVEFNVGQNKAIRPFSSGFYSADPTVYLNVNGIEHYALGFRYMLSSYFGLKMDFAYDVIKNNDQSSLAFKNEQFRIGFQGVANLGRLLKFETFTSRFGLLAHTGLQVSRHIPQVGVNRKVDEDNGGVMFGLTPQFKLSNSFVITADFTVINNLRQHFNWDGTNASTDTNLTGLMYNSSLGITFYWGTHKYHADWYVHKESIENTAVSTQKRLDELESMLNDSDKDGIPDYLDEERSIPFGVVVDTKGRNVDLSRNGIPNEVEHKIGTSDSPQTKSDAIKYLFEKGYVNIFYDVNKDEPNDSSTQSLFHVIQFLRQYPDATIVLHGFADKRGNEESNKELSLRRAKKLSSIIISSGISKDRIKVQGEGIDSSFDSRLPSGLNLARRVSITIN